MKRYNYRIIAQTSGAVYLCRTYGYLNSSDDPHGVYMTDAIRERDSGDNVVPKRWTTITGDVIIEPLPSEDDEPHQPMDAEHIRHGQA